MKTINPELFDQQYRGTIVHYWEDVCYYHKQLSPTEKKELFLYLVEAMINEKKLKFKNPKNSEIWNATAHEIAEYFRKSWPESFSNLSQDNDSDLWTFFYSMPGAVWLDEDGQWIES